MRKVTKTKHKNNVVLKEYEKKDVKKRHDVGHVTCIYLFIYFTHKYL